MFRLKVGVVFFSRSGDSNASQSYVSKKWQRQLKSLWVVEEETFGHFLFGPSA